MCICLYMYVTTSNNNMTIMYSIHVHIIKYFFAYNNNNAVLNFPGGKNSMYQYTSRQLQGIAIQNDSRLKLSMSSKQMCGISAL